MFDSEGRQLDGFDASDTHTTPDFRNWSQTFSATENSRLSLHEYNKLVCPITVFDRSATPIKYFHLFYSYNVLPKSLILPTNVNARNKFNRAEGQGQGVTVADVTFLWGCCHRSRVEGLLLPLIIDGQFK